LQESEHAVFLLQSVKSDFSGRGEVLEFGMKPLFSSPRFISLWTILLALLVLLADYFTGPVLLFPIFYILPVMFAAWHRGLALALPLAVFMPLARVFFKYLWAVPYLEIYPIINTIDRVIILMLLAFLTERVARQVRQLTREVEQLTGILPICAICKKIRSNGQWVQIEQYISERSEAEFTHGYCPVCAEKHFGEFLRDRRPKDK
jgi:signal transduction histidine kinase